MNLMNTTQATTKAFRTGFEHGRDEAAYRKATSEQVAAWYGQKADELALNGQADSLAECLGIEFKAAKGNGVELQTALSEYERGHNAGAMFWVRSN